MPLRGVLRRIRISLLLLWTCPTSYFLCDALLLRPFFGRPTSISHQYSWRSHVSRYSSESSRRFDKSTRWLAKPISVDESISTQDNLLPDELKSIASQISTIFISGLEPEERQAVQAVFSGFALIDIHRTSHVWKTFDLDLASLPPGATGRVLMVVCLPSTKAAAASTETQEQLDDLQTYLARMMDDLQYDGHDDDDDSSPTIRQPLLVSVQPQSSKNNATTDDVYDRLIMRDLIVSQVQDYGLTDPIHAGSVTDTAKRRQQWTSRIIPERIELDGAFLKGTRAPSGVEDLSESSSSSSGVWDTSSVVVMDGLVSNDLRRRLLEVVLGDDDDVWDEARLGPNPDRWMRGGLMDLPPKAGEASSHARGGYGLNDDAIAELCEEQHDAIEQFETILTDLFPQFTVTRLPEAVFGDCVSPLTANAPVHGDEYDWHIDGDPYFSPPSPWTDVYGRYQNRVAGKPRFMSCLVYLNEDWKPEWGATTRFLDVATNSFHDTEPRPGRVVLMDQDITHKVQAPSELAGKRPRYSLVLKLILHPKHSNQDMRELFGTEWDTSSWPEPKLIGSASARSS